MAKGSIGEDMKSVGTRYFTLLDDGIRDKKNTENISIGLYVTEGQIYESLLDMTSVAHDELDVVSLATKTIAVLRNAGLEYHKMLAQGGMQAIL